MPGKYRCAKCKILTSKPQVDHISPVGKFLDWNMYIERLFCPIENLQVLCWDCHKVKTFKDLENESLLPRNR